MAPESVARTPSAITGLWGEAAVVMALRDASCEVDWQGGMTKGGDLIAITKKGRRLALQVKTSTAKDGRIAWRKDGEDARKWGSEVAARGETAYYVFAHFKTKADTTIDLAKRALTVTMPEEYSVTAARFSEFAKDVDQARADYGAQVRKRTGKGGKAGDLLSPDGLQYPVYVDEYPPIGEVISKLR